MLFPHYPHIQASLGLCVLLNLRTLGDGERVGDAVPFRFFAAG
jgi:hypothetical protein